MCAIRVLSFFADGEGFAADVAFVHKFARKMKITPVPAAPREVAGIANLKGKVVTILNAAALLGANGDSGAGRSGPGRVPRAVSAVIFKPPEGGGQMGFIIDRPGDLDEIDEGKTAPSPRPEGAEPVPRISGAYESGGVLYKIVDINSIIGWFKDGGAGSAVPNRQEGTVNEEMF